jgi:hypothetical protein
MVTAAEFKMTQLHDATVHGKKEELYWYSACKVLPIIDPIFADSLESNSSVFGAKLAQQVASM